MLVIPDTMIFMLHLCDFETRFDDHFTISYILLFIERIMERSVLGAIF